LNFKQPDITSVYRNILKMDKFTKEEITDEILSCLNISFITLCPTIIDSIKELQDNPE